VDPVAPPIVERLGPVELTRRLVDIDSTTGQEGACGRVLADYLRGRGFTVTEQPVDATRFNVLATLDAPRVTLSTHFDCVPPFFPSRLEGTRVYGRGSCDAKGILASQVAAVEQLRADGVRDVGLLFVVGEERGSDGALVANELAPPTTRFLINGEPTDNRLGLATRGIYRVRLHTRGRAAHSSYPELGESAIEKLLDVLVRLRTLPWPDDPDMGRTHYNVGLIDGGVAHNVIPAHAVAEVLFRTVADTGEVRRILQTIGPGVAIEEVLDAAPVRMHTVPGFETAAFPYMTDIAMLPRWGRPLLYGPGSILVAHTDDEHIEVAHLERAVADYVVLARQLRA
jgi:acetylornithine deacetylase